MKTKIKKQKVIVPTWMLDTTEMRMYKSIKSLLPIGKMKCVDRIRFEEHMWLISCNNTNIDKTNQELKEKFMNLVLLLD